VPEARVSLDRSVYNVGDSVEFFIEGISDIITFYSGEQSKEYRYKDRTRLEGGDLVVNLETQVVWGTQEDNLKLYLSQDFTGSYTKEGIDEADWLDISDRLQWSAAAAGAAGVRTLSDTVSISDLLDVSKPVYFAFKYDGRASTTGSAQQRTWRVYQFNVFNRVDEMEIEVTDRLGAGWTAVNYSGATKGFWALTQSAATMIYYNPESNLEDAEQWAISREFDPNKVTPDVGSAIKAYSDNMIKTYRYAYDSPGEYEVNFVFINGNFNGSKEQVKTLKVMIEE